MNKPPPKKTANHIQKTTVKQSKQQLEHMNVSDKIISHEFLNTIHLENMTSLFLSYIFL
jgi:hypothetical protein